MKNTARWPMAVLASGALALATPGVALAEESAVGPDILIPKMAEFIPALIAFLVIWVVLAKLVWPQVLAMMEKRQQKIQDDLDAAERSKIQTKLDEIEKGISEKEADCERIKGDTISEELYAKFCNIVRKKKGLGIVPVHGQVCMGCDRVLPMQFVIDLRLKQQSNEIEYCPYCSRIIYYEELPEDIEKNYIFEQLEPSKGEGKSSGEGESQKSDSDSYDESMGMGEGFEDF